MYKNKNFITQICSAHKIHNKINWSTENKNPERARWIRRPRHWQTGKITLKKQLERLWTGFIWLRTETGTKCLWTPQWIFIFHTWWEIWLAKWLPVSEVEPYPMYLRCTIKTYKLYFTATQKKYTKKILFYCKTQHCGNTAEKQAT